MTAHTDSLTETIVLALSDVTGADPLDLPPLYDSVDPDALRKLVDSGDDALEVQFLVADCEVTVRGRDDVTVTPTNERNAAVPSLGIENDAAVQPTTQD